METQQKNYMDLMDEFFFQTSKLRGSATTNQTVELLKENKTLIDEISTLAKHTELFILSIHKYEEFKASMFSKREDGEKIIFAYEQLLSKMASSPTALHLKSVVVLLMPLLSDALAADRG